MDHFYHLPQFKDNLFDYQDLYTRIVNEFNSGSVFVEVGCLQGRSAAYMCVEIANSAKSIDFYCVDIWEDWWNYDTNCGDKNVYGTFLSNLSPVSEYFIPMKLHSADAAAKFKDNSIDFVFIDANHEYEHVKNDILAWYPKIKPGGILAGHDYFPDPTNGVYVAVNEIFGDTHEHVNSYCFLKRK